jgi:hypothetical protein
MNLHKEHAALLLATQGRAEAINNADAERSIHNKDTALYEYWTKVIAELEAAA